MSHVLEVVLSFAVDLLWLLVEERHWRAVAAICLAIALFIVGEVSGLNPQQPVVAFAAFPLIAGTIYGLLSLVWRVHERDGRDT